jgi:hypothetical protein
VGRPAPTVVAYTVEEIDEGTEASEIVAVDSAGLRPGWPVPMLGFGSAPTVPPGGQVVVTLGSAKRHTTRVSTVARDGRATNSPVLPFADRRAN